MSKHEKLREKLRNQPAEASMRDVQTLLHHFGFSLARTSGSHYIFEFDDGERFQQIVVPLHGRKVKKVYVRRVIEILDQLFPVEAAPDEGDEDATDEDT